MLKHMLATALLLLAAATPSTATLCDCKAKAGEWEVLSSASNNGNLYFSYIGYSMSSGSFTEDYSIIATDKVCGEINKLTYSTGAVRFTATMLGQSFTETYRTKRAAERYIETECDPDTIRFQPNWERNGIITTSTGTITSSTSK